MTETYKLYRTSQIAYRRKDRKERPWIYVLLSIRQRCTNPNCDHYKYYGGRGIKCFLVPSEIKELWFRDKACLMKRPSIDREDNNGNYTFRNCRFIELGKNVEERNKRVSSKKLSNMIYK